MHRPFEQYAEIRAVLSLKGREHGGDGSSHGGMQGRSVSRASLASIYTSPSPSKRPRILAELGGCRPPSSSPSARSLRTHTCRCRPWRGRASGRPRRGAAGSSGAGQASLSNIWAGTSVSCRSPGLLSSGRALQETGREMSGGRMRMTILGKWGVVYRCNFAIQLLGFLGI